MIEYLEDDVDVLPDSDFSKYAVIVFNKIYNVKDGVFPSSKFVD